MSCLYIGKFYVRCEVITGYPSGDSRQNDIHSQSFDNLQEYPFEAKDVILSLYRISCLYMGNFYARCEVITGYPSGDSRENVNDIHSQSFDNFLLWQKT